MFSTLIGISFYPLGGPILRPKDTWKYLGFVFDRKLIFRQHLDFYSNKALSMVKCMKLLSNSLRRISPLQKRQLYRCYILSIALYSFQLWFYNKVPLSYHLKLLNKMQRRAAIWILDVFKTSPSEEIEALTGLILIKYHLQKLAEWSLIIPFKLPENHIICRLMDESSLCPNSSNPHTIGSLTNRQRSITKSHIIDSKIKSYGVFPSFDPLYQEFTPGQHISDIFPNCFLFNLVDKKEKIITCAQELDILVLLNSSPSSTIVVTNASIKNNIATLIVYIHQANFILTKTVHHAVFVTSSEAKLFAMRCGINQACNKANISKIVVITNSIHSVKHIFDSSAYPLQLHSAAILSKLRLFFNKSHNNSIEFWECPSRLKWRFHKDVDKDTKSFKPTPISPCKISWDFCKKSDSDIIIKQWKMHFQASDGKGNNFLDLVDNSFNTIELSYIKEGPWLQAFGHSNSLCARATRAITNYAPIGEYCLRFFPNKQFSCPCNEYPIKTRRHILYECRRFNEYWNPRRDSLSHFIMFLTFNPKAFVFE